MDGRPSGWGPTTYGEPCAECGFSWAVDIDGSVALVSKVPTTYARMLQGASGDERPDPSAWTATGLRLSRGRQPEDLGRALGRESSEEAPLMSAGTTRTHWLPRAATTRSPYPPPSGRSPGPSMTGWRSWLTDGPGPAVAAGARPPRARTAVAGRGGPLQCPRRLPSPVGHPAGVGRSASVGRHRRPRSSTVVSAPGPEDVAPIEDWNQLLRDRVAVVTGGGDGIGGAISTLFAQHGALVEMAEIDSERADRTRRSIEEAGGRVHAHIVDVTDPSAVDRMAADVLARHGRVDVLDQQRRRLPPAGAIRSFDARIVERHVHGEPLPRVRRHPCLPRVDEGAGPRIDRQHPLGRGHARVSG